MDPDELLRNMKKKSKVRSTNPKFTSSDMLSSGSTLLDLNGSGSTFGLYVKGRYYYFVGDSASGKTWLVLTALAEACRNPSFKNYRLIYDDIEDGALMDLGRYFGQGVADRVEPPRRDKDGTALCSSTIEDMYDNIHDAVQVAQTTGRPFIYITDSVDALSSVAERAKTASNRKARREGKKETGSYGDGKAKKHSEHLRQIRADVLATKSILILISQTRDNIDPMAFEKKTRAGGKALRFYAHFEVWTSTVKTIKKEVNGHKYETGQICRCRIKKNRLTGRRTDVDVTLEVGYGVDDIGDMITFLTGSEYIKKVGNGLTVPRWEFKGLRSKLIRFIEENGYEKELKLWTQNVFQEIDRKLKPQRKPRYE